MSVQIRVTHGPGSGKPDELIAVVGASPERPAYLHTDVDGDRLMVCGAFVPDLGPGVYLRTDRGGSSVPLALVGGLIDAIRSAADNARSRAGQTPEIVEPTATELDAQAYRWLRDEIGKTMADQSKWDGDGAEEAILARYVQWLAAELEQQRAARDRTIDMMEQYNVTGSRGVHPRQVVNLLSLTWPDGNYEAAPEADRG